jgi:hypothetical protein
VYNEQKWLNGVSTESMQHELYSLKHSSLCSNKCDTKQQITISNACWVIITTPITVS